MSNNELMVIETIITAVNENNIDKNCNNQRFDESIKIAKRVLSIYNMSIAYDNNKDEYYAISC